MATAEALSTPIKTLPLLPPAPDFHARFSREAYHRMIDVGAIDPESRVELIDGEIFNMLPLGPSQGSLIMRLSRFFYSNLPEHLDCRVQLPIIAGDHSEPQPDIAVVRGRDSDYRLKHPSSPDVQLLVEVSESSLQFDLGPKLRLYASSGICEYWVVDPEHKILHVHRAPTGDCYSDTASLSAGESAAPLAAPTCPLAVDWLFS
jgi:Uma2 family endonuclease